MRVRRLPVAVVVIDVVIVIVVILDVLEAFVRSVRARFCRRCALVCHIPLECRGHEPADRERPSGLGDARLQPSCDTRRAPCAGLLNLLPEESAGLRLKILCGAAQRSAYIREQPSK